MKVKREELRVDNSLKYIYKIGQILNNNLIVVGHTTLSEGKKKVSIRRAYIVKCLKCGDIQTKTEKNLFKSISRNSVGCLVCLGKKVVYGVNSIHDTDYWMVELGVDFEEAKTLKSTSEKEITGVCPYCGSKFKKRVDYIKKNRGIGCHCGKSGKRSYPERFVAGLLNQLNIDYVHEYKPEWSGGRRYDFYLKETKVIIEVHGSQHYVENNFTKKTLKQEQANDLLKYKNAINNGIKNYIVINARESKKEYIINNILKSKLSTMFDLSIVNWMEVERYTMRNIEKEVCDYHKTTNKNPKELAEIFNMSYSTVLKSLNKGNDLGWCNYEKKKGCNKKVVILIDKERIVKDSQKEAIDYIRKKYGIKITRKWFGERATVPKKYNSIVKILQDSEDNENIYDKSVA